MSYSFTVKGSSKADAKDKVAAEVENIAKFQTVHKRDQTAILANANACIDLLEDDTTKDVSVNCHGSVGWSQSVGMDEYATVPLTNASISCSASLTIRTE